MFASAKYHAVSLENVRYPHEFIQSKIKLTNEFYEHMNMSIRRIIGGYGTLKLLSKVVLLGVILLSFDYIPFPYYRETLRSYTDQTKIFI